MTATSVIFITRFILPVLAIWVICRCLRSMLSEKYEPETWGHLIFPDTSAAPLPHWECLIGRSKTADIVVNSADISRLHAVLIRNDKGVWRIYDMATRGGVFVNGERVPFKGLIVQNGDRIRLSSVTLGFADLTESELRTISDHRTSAGAFINPGATLLILSLFQALVALQYSFTASDTYLTVTCLSFFALLAIEWACYLIMRSVRRTGFEVETLAFFLCTLGLSVVATSEPEELVKTVILTMVGVVLFFLMGWWLRDLRRAKFLRWPATVAAVGLLCINLVLSEYVFGAKNWLYIGGFSLQPSELVKVLYIYAGAASLDRLFARRNLLLFIGFSALCVIALALMGDYGAAMIFFVTFLVISYMRSGSIATVFLAVSGAAMAGFLVFTIKPYIAQRFATWGHVWA
ncbi:MAG: FtsW/RodA/SpoVE family cell cycle protein, partial [Oscillospiraceae bacterium]|nr:FtsW/RodA/SpoVE family cell cycle protein [Oscillospiraceae bacterium]